MSEKPILFDVNALVALSLTAHQHHRPAHAFLGALSGEWATCPITESALFRLLMNPAVTGSARSATDVSAVLSGMRRDVRWRFVDDSSSLAEPLIDMSVLMGHQQVTDFHLVNLAAERGYVLASFDRAMPTWLSPADRRHVTIIPT